MFLFKRKRICAAVSVLLMIFMLLGTVTAAAAKSEKQLRDDLKKTEDEKGQLEEDLQEGREKVSNLTDRILILEASINDKESRLKKLRKDLKKAEAKVETQTENLNGRLRNMYKVGNIGFVDVLLDSGSFTEFLTNLDLVKMIYSSDRQVLRDLEDARDEVEQKKEDIEEAKLEQEKEKTDLEDTKAEIAASNEETVNMIGELQKEADKTKELIRQKSQSGTVYPGGRMAWPVPGVGLGNITSPFGWRTHPITGVSRLHTGMDIGAPSGYKIAAANSGRVIYSGWNGGYGMCVIIDHGGGITTLYGHCSSLNVSVGQHVSRGQRIAGVGSTGFSTGPHCHFEVRINGGYVNPYPYVT